MLLDRGAYGHDRDRDCHRPLGEVGMWFYLEKPGYDGNEYMQSDENVSEEELVNLSEEDLAKPSEEVAAENSERTHLALEAVMAERAAANANAAAAPKSSLVPYSDSESEGDGLAEERRREERERSEERERAFLNQRAVASHDLRPSPGRTKRFSMSSDMPDSGWPGAAAKKRRQ